MSEVTDFFSKLFDSSGWPPRWHCGTWTEFEGWLYIISDLMIWAAYFAIPIVIVRYISRKQEAHFIRLYVLFAAFILACGSTHFLDAAAFWFPLYRLNALVRFITGIISWMTVYHLFKVLPYASTLKTAKELETEIEHKKNAEQQLKELNEELEQRVAQQRIEILATESRFRSIIENSSEAIWLLDASLRSIYSNSVAKQVTGRTEQELKETLWTTFVHPDDKEQLKTVLDEVRINHGVAYNVTFRVKHKNNNYIWLEGSYKNLLNDGLVNAIVCNFRDVTERKKIEEQRSLYEFIVNSGDDAIISKDLDGIITSWNNGAEKVFGYSHDEAIGKHISMLFPPEKIDEDRTILDRIKQGAPVAHYETERVTKDGRRIFISQAVSPIKDASGRIIGASKISRDVTEQKIIEARLVKSEKTYHAIAANLPGSIVTIIDLDRRYVLAEGEGMKNLGYTRESLVGRIESEALSADEYNGINVYRERAFAGEAVAVNFKIKDGYYFIRYIPLRDDNGNVYAVMTLTLDVTDIKKAEEEIKALNESLEKKVTERTMQLEEANKELEAFSYSVSHDLRAPLRIINGYADILQSEYGAQFDDECNRILGVIMNNTRQMGVLIDALLNLSRLGRKELTMRSTNMETMVNEIIEEQLILDSSKVKVVFADLLPSVCDNTLIRHVWTNLISNAIKYSAKNEQPVVEIGSEERDNKVVYWVKDNGVGFDMAYSHKLFGVFQRLHKKSEFEGTGIGLALVQRIVSRHGGKVWAEAVEGQGAAFYFSLPVLNK